MAAYKYGNLVLLLEIWNETVNADLTSSELFMVI